MNPTLDKPKLLDLLRAEYAFLERTLTLVPAERRAEPGVEGDWSVKDIVAHLAAWQCRLLGWFAQARRGETPSIPAPGYTPEMIDALNARTAAEDRERPWDDILAEFRESYQRCLALAESLSEAELFAPTGFRGLIEASPWKPIADNTYAHYIEHVEPIRAWLNALR